MIGAITGRELKSLFLSPLAWTILAVLLGILAWLFLTQVDQFLMIQPRLAGSPGAPGVTDLVVMPQFNLLGVLLLLTMPLITMRLISEEHRNRTLPLLLSSPVSTASIVLGKFLAVLAFAGVLVLLLLLMCLSLGLGTNLDHGQIATATIGVLLLISAFDAIGLYISCLTRQPTVAAVLTFGLLFMLWIVHLSAQGEGDGGQVFTWLSIVNHQKSFLRGLMNTTDIAYYLIITGLFLLLSIRRLDAERLQS